MSKQYVNGKWCIRCGKEGPTPYLRKNWKLLTTDPYDEIYYHLPILDMGCGNGRNIKFLKEQGFENIVAFDMAGDVGHQFTLGNKSLPLFDESVEVFLSNYVLMFLNKREREQVISDIERTSTSTSTIMVELYAAKESETPDEESVLKLQTEIFERLNKNQTWKKIRWSKSRFIAQREV
jgi:hypothetical protein